MFLGEYHLSFSGKGRVVLPKKLRVQLGKEDQVVLSRGFEGCVWGFAVKDWEKEAEKQLEIPVTEEKGRFLRRYLFSASEIVELDEQGRFVIPGSLLEYGSLEKEVVIVGAGDHFEIWDSKGWRGNLERLEREYGR